MTDSGAQRAYNFVKAGIIKGLSIGYQVDPAKVSYGDDGTRTLKEVRLFEISLVAGPCAPTAQVTSVKSLAQIETVLRTYRTCKVTDADLEQLRSIDVTLKSLLRRKSTLCQCGCAECLDGNCDDCSNDECVDESCEGSVKARQAAKELDLLKSFATELKSITGPTSL